MKRKLLLKLMIITITLSTLSGCAMFRSKLSDIQGKLVGIGFTIDTFDNFGKKTLTTHGDKITVKGNRIKEKTFTDDGVETSYSLSSVITILIDGQEMESCGDTCIFYEKGLRPAYNFMTSQINSSSNKISESTLIAGMVNSVKNKFGKKRVVVIKSQTGSLIYAFTGDKIYWSIPDDLPKFTKLNVDGKALYIHRSNFQIIDTDLL